MKILLIGDIISPAIYNINLNENRLFKNISLVISTGDLPFDYYDFIVSNLNVPLFYVFGNHTNPEDEKIEYFTNLDNKVKKFNNILIAGLEGSRRYNRGAHQYTENEMKFKILRLAPKLYYNKLRYGRYLDILVTHAPPYGFGIKTDPCHRGFNAYLDFIEKYKPKYLIHGHIHIYDRNAYKIRSYKGTKIINAYNYRIINIR